jgi:hypothetical protein
MQRASYARGAGVSCTELHTGHLFQVVQTSRPAVRCISGARKYPILASLIIGDLYRCNNTFRGVERDLFKGAVRRFERTRHVQRNGRPQSPGISCKCRLDLNNQTTSFTDRTAAAIAGIRPMSASRPARRPPHRTWQTAVILSLHARVYKGTLIDLNRSYSTHAEVTKHTRHAT